MKKTISILTILLIILIALYAIVTIVSMVTGDKEPDDTGYGGAQPLPTEPHVVEQPEPEEPEVEINEKETIIGTSVQDRNITAYHYGTGDKELLFIGGMHGGYSWNTTLVAYELMKHLEENPSLVPDTVKVTVIPTLNPDGLYRTVGTIARFSQSAVPATREETIPGRFNANEVDLNRNFDCDWQPEGTWKDTTVSAGTEAFSEPESQALKQYVDANTPSAVVVWYSAVGGVFASNCHSGILPETLTLTNLYADASGYKAYKDFNFYEITGDAVNWLAKNNIPAISVLLTTHDDVDWSQNRAGVEALLKHYTPQE